MIISHKHKYLFVELPRTGSTAISKELIDFYYGEGILFKHATYRDFLKVATEEEKQYFVFSCIRNPLDRTVSLFYKLKHLKGQYANKDYRKGRSLSSLYFNSRINYIQKHKATFSQYFDKFINIPYDDWSSLDHKKFEFIINFENLNEDFTKVLILLNLKQVRQIPIVNYTEYREKDYNKYYTSDIRKKAVKFFGPFMVKNNFHFPEDWGEIKISILTWINYYFWHLIRSLYWRYLKINK